MTIKTWCSAGVVLGVVGFVTIARADGTKKIDEVRMPAISAALSTWTAAQQWMPITNWNPRNNYGYGTSLGALVLADELGPRLSELGRASMIESCLGRGRPDPFLVLAWAACGPDVAVLDLKKLEAELVAEGVAPDSRAQVIARANSNLATAKSIGEFIENAAKTDGGIAEVLKAGESARAEWATFEGANREAIDRYLALKDAVRSGKTDDKGFDGCFEATQAPFAKIVHATKVPYQVSGDPIPSYVSYMMATTEGYVATVSYAACAYAQDSKTGEGLYAAAANQDGGNVRIGPRSLTIAKALAPSFKPKFADTHFNFSTVQTGWRYGITMPNINTRTAIATPGGGTVGSTKANGAMTNVNFKGGTVMECAEWRNTGKITGTNTNGSVIYEQTCVKQNSVKNEVSSVEFPTKYMGGIAPGVSVTTVNQFPAVAWKGTKVVAVLGIAVK